MADEGWCRGYEIREARALSQLAASRSTATIGADQDDYLGGEIGISEVEARTRARHQGDVGAESRVAIVVEMGGTP